MHWPRGASIRTAPTQHTYWSGVVLLGPHVLGPRLHYTMIPALKGTSYYSYLSQYVNWRLHRMDFHGRRSQWRQHVRRRLLRNSVYVKTQLLRLYKCGAVFLILISCMYACMYWLIYINTLICGEVTLLRRESSIYESRCSARTRCWSLNCVTKLLDVFSNLTVAS